MTRRIIRYSAAELTWIEANARRPRRGDDVDYSGGL